MTTASFFGLSILFCLIGYLFGNILFGLIISKIKKIDLRNIGSGNVGATNSLRAFGKIIGIFVMIFDMIKCWISVFICVVLYHFIVPTFLSASNYYLFTQNGFIIYLAGLFAVIGHCFPVFYIYSLIKYKGDFSIAKKYSGGKGAACAAALLAAVSPWIFVTAFFVFFIVVLLTRYVSLSSIIAVSISSFLTFIPHLDYLYILSIPNLLILDSIPNVNQAYNVANIINYQNNWWYILSLFLILFLASFVVVYRHKQNIVKLINKSESKIF